MSFFICLEKGLTHTFIHHQLSAFISNSLKTGPLLLFATFPVYLRLSDFICEFLNIFATQPNATSCRSVCMTPTWGPNEDPAEKRFLPSWRDWLVTSRG
ncbi:hypothetical protein B9K06_11755 [Bacillus sp. OG2]|nr:hypothetical protein B9K06_11755 [Bacillus sp. OG2]